MKDNKPSSTACLVALGTFLIVHEINDEQWDSRVKKYLLEITRRLPWHFSIVGALIKFKTFRFFLERVMSLVIPGMFSHYVARKIFIETQVKEAIADGCQQLVVIGGGLDTLAMRTHVTNPSLSVVELDHPATQAIKRHALKNLVQENQNIHFVPVDLTQRTISEALAETDFNPSSPTVFVIEGVLMYLTEEDVRETLAHCVSLSAQGSRVILTFLEKNKSGTAAFQGSRNHLVGAWLKKESEPFIWGLSPNSAFEFFASTRNTVRTISQWDQLTQAIGSLPHWIHPPAQGEFIAVLEPMSSQKNGNTPP